MSQGRYEEWDRGCGTGRSPRPRLPCQPAPYSRPTTRGAYNYACKSSDNSLVIGREGFLPYLRSESYRASRRPAYAPSPSPGHGYYPPSCRSPPSHAARPPAWAPTNNESLIRLLDANAENPYRQPGGPIPTPETTDPARPNRPHHHPPAHPPRAMEDLILRNPIFPEKGPSAGARVLDTGRGQPARSSNSSIDKEAGSLAAMITALSAGPSPPPPPPPPGGSIPRAESLATGGAPAGPGTAAERARRGSRERDGSGEEEESSGRKGYDDCDSHEQACAEAEADGWVFVGTFRPRQ